MSTTDTEVRAELGERSQAVREKLINRTPKSAAVSQRGRETLAQEVVQTVDLPHPIYIESAEGPYLTDVDGNRYIDLTGGFGPNVLGNKPEVVEASPASADRQGLAFWHPGRRANPARRVDPGI